MRDFRKGMQKDFNKVMRKVLKKGAKLYRKYSVSYL
jgi:hypothetical protein